MEATILYLKTSQPELLRQAVQDINEMNLPTFAHIGSVEKHNDTDTKFIIEIDSPVTAYHIGKRFAELKMRS